MSPQNLVGEIAGRLVGHFLKGCLVLFPVVGTIYAVWFVLGTIDGAMGNAVGGVPAPGLGVVLAVLLVTVVGVVASNVVGQSAVRRMEGLVDRVPLVRLIYGAIRDVVAAFVGERRSFERAARVRVTDGVWVFGFLTREHFDDPALADHVAVYLPQAYTWAGNLLVVERDRVELVEMSGPEVLAFVVSGGVHGS